MHLVGDDYPRQAVWSLGRLPVEARHRGGGGLSPACPNVFPRWMASPTRINPNKNLFLLFLIQKKFFLDKWLPSIGQDARDIMAGFGVCPVNRQ